MSVYLYGITPAPGPGEITVAGVERGRVRAVTAGDLSATVSDVATVPVRAGRDNLMAHSRVLETVHSVNAVVPAGFGTVFPDDEILIAELLEGRRDQLHRLLGEFEGRAEFTVKAFYDQESVLKEIVAEEPSIRALRDELRKPGAREPYLGNVRLGEMVATALARKRETDAQRILALLGPLAIDVRVGEALVEGIVVNASLLVDGRREPDFDRAVATLEDELRGRVAIKYVGPLPPYSFVDLEPITSGDTPARSG